MDVDESIAQVKRLLCLLPGVEMAWEQKTPSHIRLGLVVRSPSSLALLANIAWAANVSLGVGVDWNWKGKTDDPECLRYCFRVSRDDESEMPPTKLQKIGVFLVWHLKKEKLLAAKDANKLLKAWNAALNSRSRAK